MVPVQWPLYPGILLTTALAGSDLWRLVPSSMPPTVVAVGYWPLRGDTTRGEEGPAAKPMVPFLKKLAPFVFVIVCGVGLGLLLSNEYFDTNIGEVSRCLRVPLMAPAAGDVAYFGVLGLGMG